VVVGIAAALTGAVLFGLAGVVQASAARRLSVARDGFVNFWLTAARDLSVLGVIVTYLVGFLLHAVAIWLVPLYLAQAALALALPVATIAAHRLGERATHTQWAAVGTIAMGLVILAAGAGAPGRVEVGSAPLGVLITGVVVTLTFAAALLNRPTLASPALHGLIFGALSGLGYAGSALAVRMVTTPWDLVTVVAAGLVGGYGAIGFWLYSVGLSRGGVASVTAAQVVMQTLIPAVVGVTLFQDQVRSGWGPAVALGVTLSTGGAVWLSRATR
jgi:hypothetical protein